MEGTPDPVTMPRRVRRIPDLITTLHGFPDEFAWTEQCIPRRCLALELNMFHDIAFFPTELSSNRDDQKLDPLGFYWRERIQRILLADYPIYPPEMFNISRAAQALIRELNF